MNIIPIYDAAANNDPAFRSDIQTAINIYDSTFTAEKHPLVLDMLQKMDAGRKFEFFV